MPCLHCFPCVLFLARLACSCMFWLLGITCEYMLFLRFVDLCLLYLWLAFVCFHILIAFAFASAFVCSLLRDLVVWMFFFAFICCGLLLLLSLALACSRLLSLALACSRLLSLALACSCLLLLLLALACSCLLLLCLTCLCFIGCVLLTFFLFLDVTAGLCVVVFFCT